MNKRIKLLTIVSSILIIGLLAGVAVKAVNFNDNQTVDISKTWPVKFTSEVGFDDSTKKGITVTDSKGIAIDVGIQLGRTEKQL